MDDSFTGNSTYMTVLQRHQAIFGRQQEDQRQDNNAIESYAMPRLQSLVGDDSMVYQELMSRSMNADQYLGSMFPAFRELQFAGTEFIGNTISIAPLQLVTSSSPEVNHSFSVGLNLKKRKADEVRVFVNSTATNLFHLPFCTSFNKKVCLGSPCSDFGPLLFISNSIPLDIV